MKKDKIDYFEIVRTTMPIATSSGGEFINMILQARKKKGKVGPDSSESPHASPNERP